MDEVVPRKPEPAVVSRCQRCGASFGGGMPTSPLRCGDCPAVPCFDCREPDDRYCSCWTRLDGLNLADLKAAMAQAGLSVG